MSRIGRLLLHPRRCRRLRRRPGHQGQGPQGRASLTVPAPITVEQADGTLEVKRPNDEREARSLHGLTRSLLNNMVLGVTEGYEKKMEIYGTGYRVAARARTSSSRSGTRTPFSSRRRTGSASPSRPDALLGAGHRQAARRRGRREHPQAPQARPYKGKGVRYASEQIRRKVGKAGK